MRKWRVSHLRHRHRKECSAAELYGRKHHLKQQQQKEGKTFHFLRRRTNRERTRVRYRWDRTLESGVEVSRRPASITLRTAILFLFVFRPCYFLVSGDARLRFHS